MHALAAWAAQVVTIVRDTGGLLPLELCHLVDEVADRASVRRASQHGLPPGGRDN